MTLSGDILIIFCLLIVCLIFIVIKLHNDNNRKLLSIKKIEPLENKTYKSWQTGLIINYADIKYSVNKLNEYAEFTKDKKLKKKILEEFGAFK